MLVYMARIYFHFQSLLLIYDFQQAIRYDAQFLIGKREDRLMRRKKSIYWGVQTSKKAIQMGPKITTRYSHGNETKSA